MRIVRDIVYIERQGLSLALDLYLPPKPATATVLHAHGGGFTKGERTGARTHQIATRLTAQGLAMAAVSYRLGTPGAAFSATQRARIQSNRRRSLDQEVEIAKRLMGPAFAAARDDIGAAIGFLRARHTDFDIAGNRLALLGISAGGIAGLTLGYPSEPLPDSQKPDAIIALGAALIQPWGLGADGPPTLMIHSNFDRLIAPLNARNAAAAAQACDAPLAVMMCARAGHNAPLQALLSDDAPDGTSYWDHMSALFERAGLFTPLPAGA